MKHELLVKIEKYNEKHGVVFDEKMHLYIDKKGFLNQSISAFTNFNPPTFVPFIEVYAVIGTIYHKIIEHTLKGEDVDYNALEQQYKDLVDNLRYDTENWKQWQIDTYEELKETYVFKTIKYDHKLFKKFHNKAKRKFNKYTLIGSEVLVYDRWKRVAGIVDLLVEWKGKIFIIDFKTSAEVGLSHILQINTYTKILKSNYRIEANELIITKIKRETGVMSDTKVTDISNNIWNNLPPKCWETPIEFGNIEEEEKLF